MRLEVRILRWPLTSLEEYDCRVGWEMPTETYFLIGEKWLGAVRIVADSPRYRELNIQLRDAGP